MPVRAIALRLPQLIQPSVPFPCCVCIINFPVNAQHLLIHPVYLRIFNQKITPQAAVHELDYILAAFCFKLTLKTGIFPGLIGRQRPFHHLLIRRAGQIYAAYGREPSHIFTQLNGINPCLIIFERSKKSIHPSLLPAMLVSAGPNAELLAVITQYGYPILLVRSLTI